MFLNDQIQIENLPRLEALQLSGISPKYKTVLYLNFLIIFMVALLVFIIVNFFVADNGMSTGMLAGVLASWCLGLFLVVLLINLSFKKRQYALRDKDVTYSEGLLVHSITTIPFNRIQHVEISRTFLARKLGLATLHLYSAGQSGSDLSIKGLPLNTAQSINGFLTKKLDEQP